VSYATPEQLAEALETRVTDANRELLQACLDAAASEVDHFLDRREPLPVPTPPEVVRANVNRAVEWFKAPATYNGGVGFADTGVLDAPGSGFERHGASIIGLKQAWGIG
jgi:hypothetical protein